ncbi:MAG: hypothetical protein AAGA54_27030 [Myxococcota bacterium]
MSPRGSLRVVVATLGMAAVLWMFGGPSSSGALAGLHAGPGTFAIGLGWMLIVPLCWVVVPPLAFAAGLELLAARR